MCVLALCYSDCRLASQSGRKPLIALSKPGQDGGGNPQLDVVTETDGDEPTLVSRRQTIGRAYSSKPTRTGRAAELVQQRVVRNGEVLGAC